MIVLGQEEYVFFVVNLVTQQWQWNNFPQYMYFHYTNEFLTVIIHVTQRGSVWWMIYPCSRGKSIGYCNVTCACSQYWRLEFKEVHITKLLWSILSYLQTLLMHSTLITVYGYMYWLLSKCSFLHLVNMLEFKYTKLLLSILSYLLQTLLMYPYNTLGVHVLAIVKM